MCQRATASATTGLTNNERSSPDPHQRRYLIAAEWQHISGSTLAQVIANDLTKLFSVVWWVINTSYLVWANQRLPWGSPLHAWLTSVNWIGCARYLNRGYRYGARGMHYHILLRPYSQNYYTYNSAVKNTYSPCHKDAYVQISIGNTEWLLRYKGAR